MSVTTLAPAHPSGSGVVQSVPTDADARLPTDGHGANVDYEDWHYRTYESDW